MMDIGDPMAIKSSKAKFGDIACYNKSINKVVIIPYNTFIGDFDKDNYIPIGLVVIPGDHNVYNNNKCGVMSLKYMSYSNPNVGATSLSVMYFGNSSYIDNLRNYDGMPIVGYDGNIENSVQLYMANGCLPSNNYARVPNPYDEDTEYADLTGTYYIASPYNNDDTRNILYYQTTSPSKDTNALNDFNGKENNKCIIEFATTQSDWKTASSITNSYQDGYYPVSCCCWRYFTDGTKQGDWYLPSCGEVGYLIPKFKTIKKRLNKIVSMYDKNHAITNISGTSSYWSSTKNENTIYKLDSTNGKLSKFSHVAAGCAIAFLQI